MKKIKQKQMSLTLLRVRVPPENRKSYGDSCLRHKKTRKEQN